jgi:hypothetical protein
VRHDLWPCSCRTVTAVVLGQSDTFLRSGQVFDNFCKLHLSRDTGPARADSHNFDISLEMCVLAITFYFRRLLALLPSDSLHNFVSELVETFVSGVCVPIELITLICRVTVIFYISFLVHGCVLVNVRPSSDRLIQLLMRILLIPAIVWSEFSPTLSLN